MFHNSNISLSYYIKIKVVYKIIINEGSVKANIDLSPCKEYATDFG